MPKIVITNELIRNSRDSGISINDALELQYEKELREMRADARLSKKSATKLALIDSGIRGNHIVDKMFTTDGNENLFAPYIEDIINTTIADDNIMNFLVSQTHIVPSDVIKAPFVDLLEEENKKNLKRARVAEGAEFARKVASITSKSVEFHKKGISLGQTYESARRTPVDMFSMLVKFFVNDIINQNVDEAAYTLASGNVKNFATTATENIITPDELYDTCTEYFMEHRYAPTTILVGKELFKSLSKAKYSTNETFGVNQKMSMNIPQVGNFSVDLIYSANMPTASNGKNQALLYNKERTLRRYLEAGSSLQEYDKEITRQNNIVVISENSGFAKFFDSAVSIVSK